MPNHLLNDNGEDKECEEISFPARDLLQSRPTLRFTCCTLKENEVQFIPITPANISANDTCLLYKSCNFSCDITENVKYLEEDQCHDITRKTTGIEKLANFRIHIGHSNDLIRRSYSLEEIGSRNHGILEFTSTLTTKQSVEYFQTVDVLSLYKTKPNKHEKNGSLSRMRINITPCPGQPCLQKNTSRESKRFCLEDMEFKPYRSSKKDESIIFSVTCTDKAVETSPKCPAKSKPDSLCASIFDDVNLACGPSKKTKKKCKSKRPKKDETCKKIRCRKPKVLGTVVGQSLTSFERELLSRLQTSMCRLSKAIPCVVPKILCRKCIRKRLCLKKCPSSKPKVELECPGKPKKVPSKPSCRCILRCKSSSNIPCPPKIHCKPSDLMERMEKRGDNSTITINLGAQQLVISLEESNKGKKTCPVPPPKRIKCATSLQDVKSDKPKCCHCPTKDDSICKCGNDGADYKPTCKCGEKEKKEVYPALEESPSGKCSCCSRTSSKTSRNSKKSSATLLKYPCGCPKSNSVEKRKPKVTCKCGEKANQESKKKVCPALEEKPRKTVCPAWDESPAEKCSCCSSKASRNSSPNPSASSSKVLCGCQIKPKFPPPVSKNDCTCQQDDEENDSDMEDENEEICIPPDTCECSSQTSSNKKRSKSNTSPKPKSLCSCSSSVKKLNKKSSTRLKLEPKCACSPVPEQVNESTSCDSGSKFAVCGFNSSQNNVKFVLVPSVQNSNRDMQCPMKLKSVLKTTPSATGKNYVCMQKPSVDECSQTYLKIVVQYPEDEDQEDEEVGENVCCRCKDDATETVEEEAPPDMADKKCCTCEDKTTQTLDEDPGVEDPGVEDLPTEETLNTEDDTVLPTDDTEQLEGGNDASGERRASNVSIDNETQTNEKVQAGATTCCPCADKDMQTTEPECTCPMPQESVCACPKPPPKCPRMVQKCGHTQIAPSICRSVSTTKRNTSVAMECSCTPEETSYGVKRLCLCGVDLQAASCQTAQGETNEEPSCLCSDCVVNYVSSCEIFGSESCPRNQTFVGCGSESYTLGIGQMNDSYYVDNYESETTCQGMEPHNHNSYVVVPPRHCKFKSEPSLRYKGGSYFRCLTDGNATSSYDCPFNRPDCSYADVTCQCSETSNYSIKSGADNMQVSECYCAPSESVNQDCMSYSGEMKLKSIIKKTANKCCQESGSFDYKMDYNPWESTFRLVAQCKNEGDQSQDCRGTRNNNYRNRNFEGYSKHNGLRTSSISFNAEDDNERNTIICKNARCNTEKSNFRLPVRISNKVCQYDISPDDSDESDCDQTYSKPADEKHMGCRRRGSYDSNLNVCTQLQLTPSARRILSSSDLMCIYMKRPKNYHSSGPIPFTASDVEKCIYGVTKKSRTNSEKRADSFISQREAISQDCSTKRDIGDKQQTVKQQKPGKDPIKQIGMIKLRRSRSAVKDSINTKQNKDLQNRQKCAKQKLRSKSVEDTSKRIRRK